MYGYAGNNTKGMKYFKRLEVFKNSTGTCRFNPRTMRGTSYNWTFVAKVRGVVLFNSYSWSVTTSGHQSDMRATLRNAGIKFIEADFGRRDMDLDSGSGDVNGISAVVYLYEDLIKAEIEIDMTKRKDTWAFSSRVAKRDKIQNALDILESLKYKISEKRKKEIRERLHDEALNEYSDKLSAAGFEKYAENAAVTDLSPVQF